MATFKILEKSGRELTVTNGSIPNLYYLSDEEGHLCEFGYNEKSRKWIPLSFRLSTTRFDFDSEEIGELITIYYN